MGYPIFQVIWRVIRLIYRTLAPAGSGRGWFGGDFRLPIISGLFSQWDFVSNGREKNFFLSKLAPFLAFGILTIFHPSFSFNLFGQEARPPEEAIVHQPTPVLVDKGKKPDAPPGNKTRSSERLRVFCVGVIDGDTIRIVRGGRTQLVRLAGIDAPEKEGPYTHREAFSGDAARYLEKLVYRKTIYLEAAKPALDRFGRFLAFVFLEEGTFVNGELIRAGYAQVFWKAESPYKKTFVQLEQEAKRRCLGIWSAACPEKK